VKRCKPLIVERRTESCITPQQLMRVSKAAGWALKDERSPQVGWCRLTLPNPR
jgi:hypothetical protein